MREYKDQGWCSCGARLRPYRTRPEDYPGTRAPAGKGRCVNCYAVARNAALKEPNQGTVGSCIEWMDRYTGRRRRAGIGPEGILMAGEQPTNAHPWKQPAEIS